MSVIIHHGNPGSYKSSGVIQRFIIPELIKGRVLVTNIRGLDSLENIEKSYSIKLPSTAKILYIDTKGKQPKLDLACWFHWAPKGALIVIDECQMIYPKRRDFKLESLDYKGGADQAAKDDRPADFAEAFDMHRHHNWDIYLCTPNISKVNSEIRQVCEVAFRHYSMGDLVPWKKNKWREVEHDGDNSGKSASHAYGSPKEYKVDPRVFGCYQSTTTGEHKQNSGASAFYKDKKLIAVFVVLILAISFFVNSVVKIADRQANRNASSEVVNGKNSKSFFDANNDDSNDGNDSVPVDVVSVVEHPFSDAKIMITGTYSGSYQFKGEDENGTFYLSYREMRDHGYRIVYKRPCFAEVYFDQKLATSIYCARYYDVASNGHQAAEVDTLIGDFSVRGALE